MRLEKFLLEQMIHNFYFEDEDDPKTGGKAKKIVLFTSRKTEKNKTKTIKTLEKYCEENKIEYKVCFVEDSYIINEKNKTFISNANDEEPMEISPKNTLIICRASVASTTASLDVVTQLEKMRFFCLNSRDCIETCADKFRTAMRLVEQGVSTPRTAMVRTLDGIEHAFEQVGGKFPVVLKTIFGTKGHGVFVVESEKSLKSVLQTLWTEAPKAEILMQEFIENAGYDYRVHVLNDKVFAVMKRISGDTKKEFRTNYSLGGSIENVELNDFPPELKDLAVKASKAVKGIWTGVDIMVAKKDKKAYILEVNSSPGTEGIEQATGIPVMRVVLDYATKKANWRLATITCGFKENIWIEANGFEIGYVTAKFDTGNGSMCAMHADSVKIDDGKVHWTYGGKKYINKLVSMKTVVVGGLKTKYEERPVIKLTIKFNGDVYKGIPFCLTNRHRSNKKHQTDILIDRSFMKLAGLNVDPSSEYILSIKNPVDDADLA